MLLALSVASGRVVFFPVTGMPIPVVSGQEMHMKVAINPTVGAVESEQPTSTNISMTPDRRLSSRLSRRWKRSAP